tara:strand:+ start:53 stop:664 length:612 start_codon:yes stop_codon:yes gene_type:complete
VDLNYNIVNIFPNSIHNLSITDFHECKDELVKEAYQEKESDPIGRKLSNRGGWQSNQFELHECKSEILQKVIKNLLSEFSKNLLQKNVYMKCQGWTNINGPGDFNAKHNHPRSHLSGVFWIKVPKNSGSIKFHSPEIFNRFQELDCYTEEFCYDSNCYMTHDFTPHDGEILIFPSSLEHEVMENKSNEDRISYSFNLVLKHEE